VYIDGLRIVVLKAVLKCAVTLVVAGVALAQSPPAQATVTIGGKRLTIKYSAPSVRGRKIFVPGGVISRDPTYPVWRAGADEATAFHTDADLDVAGLQVPKGDYTLWILIKDPEAWQLIINKETGQWGLSYEAARDLGRVKMTMSKPSASIEKMKYTLSDLGSNKGKLQVEWENHIASVPIAVK
jgi:hypothetical protein